MSDAPGSTGTRGATALTIAGSDPTGGAGIQVDLQAFAARGVRGGAVITAITVQSGGTVSRVDPVEATLVGEQVDAALAELAPSAVKCGMLATAAAVRAVHRVLERFPDIPLVVDPVLHSGNGTPLMDDKGAWALCDVLLPRTDLLTPNAAEASVLFDGAQFHVFEAPRVDLGRTHGTGCLLSALITAELARGNPLVLAVLQAKSLLLSALEHGSTTPTGLRAPDILRLRDET